MDLFKLNIIDTMESKDPETSEVLTKEWLFFHKNFSVIISRNLLNDVFGYLAFPKRVDFLNDCMREDFEIPGPIISDLGFIDFSTAYDKCVIDIDSLTKKEKMLYG